MISLKPPTSPSLAEATSTFQPRDGGIALVHAEQVAGEQRRLVAAGAGADFEDGVLLVGGVLGQQQDLDVLLQRLDALLELRQLGLGQRPHLGIGRLVGEHRLEIGMLLLGGAATPGSWPTISCSSEYSEASFT